MESRNTPHPTVVDLVSIYLSVEKAQVWSSYTTMCRHKSDHCLLNKNCLPPGQKQCKLQLCHMSFPTHCNILCWIQSKGGVYRIDNKTGLRLLVLPCFNWLAVFRGHFARARILEVCSVEGGGPGESLRQM